MAFLCRVALVHYESIQMILVILALAQVLIVEGKTFWERKRSLELCTEQGESFHVNCQNFR